MTDNHRLFALLSVLLQAVTIVLLKYVAMVDDPTLRLGLIALYSVIIAIILLRVIFWNLALGRGKLSDVFRYTALVPVLVLLGSGVFLRENISVVSGAGALIIAGAIYGQQRGRAD